MPEVIIPQFTSAQKYHRWYFAIIDRARDRKLNDYRERHHAIPRSLGGTNEKHNLVDLTFREHFLCHWLLTRMTDGVQRRSMLAALTYMCNGSGVWKKKGRNYREGRGVIPSWRYDVARRAARNAQIGNKRPGMHSEEFKITLRERMKGNNYKKGKKQGPHSLEARERMKAAWTEEVLNKHSERMKGNSYGSNQIWTEERRIEVGKRLGAPEVRAKVAAKLKGRKRPDISARLKGKKRPDVSARFKGIVRSAEYREKQRIAQTGKKMSLEACQKMSAAKSGKKLSPEHYAKIYTEEHRAKLAALVAERNRSRSQTKGLNNG